MRKFILFTLIVIAVLVLLVLGAVRFITLDDYKEEMIRMAEEATGQEIRLEGVSLTFRPGLALRLHGLEVLSSDRDMKEPLVSVPRFDAQVDWRSLFRGQWAIGYAVFDSPIVRLRLDQPVSLGSQPRSETNVAGGVGAAAALMTNRFSIQNGTVLIMNPERRTGETGLRDVDLELRDLSLTRKATFDLKSSVIESARQNLQVTGELGPLSSQDFPSTVRVQMRLDFDSMEFDKLKLQMPELGDLPLSGRPIQGFFEGEVTRLNMTRGGVFEGLEARGELNIRELRLDFMAEPFRDFKSEMTITGRSAEIPRSEVSLGEGTAAFAFESQDIFGGRGHHLLMGMRQMELHDFFPTPQDSNAVELHGLMQADLDIGFDGIKTEDIQNSLRGQGAFSLEQGRVENFNILARVLDKVSRIPVIGRSIAQRVAQKYQAFLQEDNMRIHQANGQFILNQGRAEVSQLFLESDYFQAVAGGTVSLQGEVYLPGQLFLSQDLSEAMVSAVHDLASMSDQYGRLVFPFTVVGTFPHVKVQLDQEYMISQLVQSRAEKLIDNFLDKDGNSSSSGEKGDIMDRLLGEFIR